MSRAEDDYARLVAASEAYDAALMRDLEQRGGKAYGALRRWPSDDAGGAQARRPSER
jgi:hypothetical protein